MSKQRDNKGFWNRYAKLYDFEINRFSGKAYAEMHRIMAARFFSVGADRASTFCFDFHSSNAVLPSQLSKYEQIAGSRRRANENGVPRKVGRLCGERRSDAKSERPTLAGCES